MTRFLRFVGARLKRLLSARVPLPQSPVGWLMAALSTVGVASLGYVGGAAVMFYELPSCDLLHTNSVKILIRALAPRFPSFQSGQVLLSLRNLDALIVLDLATRRVVWAAQGIWRIQHDAEFLDNGHLLVYDNGGSPRGTRILEYDPLTQAIPWLYADEKKRRFRADFRGASQRLPNGNTLIVDPDHCRLLEVTQDKEIVWVCFCPLPPVTQDERPINHPVNCARRYSADELPFLKGSGCR